MINDKIICSTKTYHKATGSLLITPGFRLVYNKLMLKKTKKINFSIVIPNWNGEKIISDCLDSIFEQTLKPYEIIVVDNGSTDGAVDLIKKRYPTVRLIELGKNTGFTGGVNTGIKAAKGDYVFLFNNDAKMEKDCLQKLISTAQKENSDITQCVILTNNGRLIDSVGDEYSKWGIPYPGMRNQPAELVPKHDKPIFSASGGASLYKRSLFEEIGYFDESFFAYFEDVDISMRAHLLNKRLYLSHKAVVHHRMNFSSNKIPGFSREMVIKNSYYLYWKNIPFPLNLKILPKFIYCNLRMTGAALIKGAPLNAIKAQATAFIHLPRMLFQRLMIQRSKKITCRQFEKMLSTENPFSVAKNAKSKTDKA